MYAWFSSACDDPFLYNNKICCVTYMMTVLLGLLRLLIISVIVNYACLTLLCQFRGGVLLFHPLISQEITATLRVRFYRLLLAGCDHALLWRHASRGLRYVLGRRRRFVISEYYISLVDHFDLILCLSRGGLSFLTLRLNVMEHVGKHFFVRGDVNKILGLEGLLLDIKRWGCLDRFWINNWGV